MAPLAALRFLAPWIAFVALAAGAQDVRLAPPRLQVTGPVERPVELRSVRIETEVDGSLALTTVEMEFHNPNGRVLEGDLAFPLLAGQVVAGFALDVDGRMRDAVPVEKARAQAVFEEITRARVDPGLLQATEGDNYRIRVYPIPARGERRVLVRYVETVAARGNLRIHRVPLAYAKEARDFSLEARVEGEARPMASPGPLGDLELHRVGSGWRALARRAGGFDGVLELSIPEGRAAALARRHGEGAYFLAEARVRGTQRARALPRTVQLVWDSSGSMAGRDLARERALLDAYFAAARDVDVRLVRIRDVAEPAVHLRVSGGDWSALRRALEETAYDGATNLGAIPRDPEAREMLLFSDGLANFGEPASAHDAIPVYAISSVAGSASVALRHRAEASGGRYIDLSARTAAGARELLLNAVTRIESLDGEGVSDLVARTTIAADGRIAVAGRLAGREGKLRIAIRHADGSREVIAIPVTADGREGRLAATLWASWRIALLEADPEVNRAAIRRLGRAFGLATRETSLIVLERAEDYARHEIDPPAELAAAYASLRAQATQKRDADRHAHVERIVQRFMEKVKWWERDFPKDTPARREPEAKTRAGAVEERTPATAAAPAPPSLLRAAPAQAAPGSVDRVAAERDAAGRGDAPAATIRLRPWRPDAPYAARMRESPADRVYRVYLDERPDYARSSAFFLDAADILFEKNEPQLAVRVLSNLAEMDLENRHVLRILGYRLLQAKRPELAVPVFRKVLSLSPEEPQSYRDLGLAYQATGEGQKAVDQLAEVVMRPWHGRFPDIELIALAELNAIAATAPGAPLDTSRVDPRLLRNLPLDLRVILTWDADNTDIDLWVTDPNGEKAYYGHRLTYQGGQMSLDFTGGYGPEEFSLRRAKPGTYKVEANFYGHRQQVVAGATTLQVKLTTGFGTREAREQIVTLRLKGASEVVYVGDFEVR